MADKDHEEEDERKQAEALIAQLTVQPVGIVPVQSTIFELGPGLLDSFLRGVLERVLRFAATSSRCAPRCWKERG